MTWKKKKQWSKTIKSEPNSLKRLIKLISLQPNRSKKKENTLPISEMREERSLQIIQNKRIKREYYELYANECDNFDEKHIS